MAEGGLSIGTLSGRIELDDKFTATLTISNEALDALEKRFGGVHASAVHVAEGMLIAETAIEAVKEVAHLAAEALSEITVEGAKVADVEQNFNRLTLAAGDLGEELLGSLKKGTHDTITDFELMKSVNDNLAAGVKLTDAQYSTLATGAFALAQAKGMEVKDAFERINDALLTGRVRGVQYLTGKLDLAAAEEAYAKSIGTTAERLDAEEKVEAARVAILDRVSASVQRLGEQHDGLDEKIAQAGVRWKNFQEDLGKMVATSPVILHAFDEVSDILTEAFGTDKEHLIEVIVGKVEGLAVAGVEVVRVGTDVVKFMVEWRSILEPLAVGLGGITTALVAVKLGEEAVETASKFWVALTPGVLAFGAAAASVYAAFELGKWQPVSDFFEQLGLEVFYGLSSQEAFVAVQTHHMTDEMVKATAAAKEHSAAAEEIALATQNWREVILTISPEIANEAEHLLASGVSAKTVAEEFKLTAGQTKALQSELAENARIAEHNEKMLAQMNETVKLSKKELKDFADTWESLNSIGHSYEETLAGVNPKIVESVKYYADLGASVNDLEKAFPGLTKAQAEAAVQGAKSALEIQKAWTDVFAIQMKLHGDNIDDFIKLETRRFDTHIKQLEQEGKLTEDRLNAEKALYMSTIEAEIQKRTEQIDTSRAFFQKEADEAKAKLDLMIENSGDFVEQDIQLARQQYAEKERILEHWAAYANEKIEAKTAKDKEELGKQGRAIDEMSTHWNGANAAIDMNIQKVRTLSGELISLAEFQKRQSAGSSMTYDLSTKAGLDTFHKLNPAATSSYSDQQIMYAVQHGASLQSLIQAGIISLYGKGMPGFAGGTGGEYVDFGPGTIAMLHGKEAIVPEGQGLGGGHLEMNFYVNGTAVQVAQQIKELIMRELKGIKQFGA